ncbi:MAG: hypothetical protein ACRD00_02530, partial [Thermoanaerobaculia bacterium]
LEPRLGVAHTAACGGAMRPERSTRRLLLFSALSAGAFSLLPGGLTNLKIRIDAAGSIYGRREGTENLPVILFGSHIDSVPMGGNFDGDVGSL